MNISKKNKVIRLLSILIVYFGIYSELLPIFLRKVTLALNPKAEYIDFNIALACNIVIIVVVSILAYPWLKDGYLKIKDSMSDFYSCVAKNTALLLASSVVSSMIVNFITGMETSNNQNNINNSYEIAPFYLIFNVVIFAPIVEELVFRGAIFNLVKGKKNFWIANIISAFIFGFIHVSASLYSGNYLDLTYIITYMSMGIVLGLAYKDSDSIFGSIAVHFVNNAIACLVMVI